MRAYGLPQNKFPSDWCNKLNLDIVDGVYLHGEALKLNNGFDLVAMDRLDIRNMELFNFASIPIRVICGKDKTMRAYLYYWKDSHGRNRGLICEEGNVEVVAKYNNRSEVI